MTRAFYLGMSLGGAALILVLVLEIYVWWREPDPLARGTAQPDSALMTDSPAEAVAPATLLAAVLARPLFTPGRQVAVSAEPPAPASPPSPVLPRLAGIVISPSDRSAIFSAPGGAGKPVVVRVGSHLGAYEVISIVAGEVRIRGAQGDQVLHPVFDGLLNTGEAGQNPAASKPER